MSTRVPEQHRPTLKQGITTYEVQNREPAAALVGACVREFAQVTAAEWKRAAARLYAHTCGVVKRGGRVLGEAGRMSEAQYHGTAAKLIAMQKTAPSKKGKNLAEKLKRIGNALWEALNRPNIDEGIRIATDGSHTLGAGTPAGWGAAVWEGDEGPENSLNLFGPVILDPENSFWTNQEIGDPSTAQTIGTTF